MNFQTGTSKAGGTGLSERRSVGDSKPATSEDPKSRSDGPATSQESGLYFALKIGWIL